MSLKKSKHVLACTTAVLSLGAGAAGASSLTINDSAPVDIPSFNYVNQGSTASTLAVNVNGFAFCANIYQQNPPPPTAVTMLLQRPRWALPSAEDVRTVGYVNGVLGVNKGFGSFVPEATLACQLRGPYGELVSPFTGFGDKLFTDGLDALDDPSARFADLFNWQPVPGFSWSAPDWTLVPNDSCTWDNSTNRPRSSEDSLCAAASGVRPLGLNSQNDPRYGDRAATMWTKTTSTHFIYLARIDARFGVQDGTAPNTHFPQSTAAQTSASSVQLRLRDGYDSTYLSSAGTYCLLRSLPAALTDNVCSGSEVFSSGTVDGNLYEPLGLDNAWVKAKSLYVAIVRTKSTDPNNLPPISTPVAAIAAIADPGVVRHEGGDEFLGDDVVFGFPEGQGFPWMGGQ